MIGRLRGTVLEKIPPRLLLDVNGVAYEIEAPMFTFYRLPDIGQETVLHTHLVVREDAHLLYGFAQEQERMLFRHLIKVSAVGPKLALAILSGMEPQDFVDLIRRNESTSLIKIPGVGKKTAERLVIEMRDRLADWKLPQPVVGVSPRPQSADLIAEEAINALIALGYKPSEARQAISFIEKDHSSSEELIRHALRNML